MKQKFFGFQWHITNYCNLRCRHCYQSDFTRKDDLPLKVIIDIIDKLSDSLKDSKILVNLTGGEPLLFKGLYNILDSFEKKENIETVNVITNGLFLDHKTIERLNSYKKIKELKVSLEAGESRLNDSIRGTGIFERVLKNINCALEKFKKEIILMFTLGSYNYRGLKEMLKLGAKLKVNGVIIERFVPWGRGLEIKNEFLKPEEWRRVIKIIIEFTDLGLSPEELLPYKAFHIYFNSEREVKGALCNLGDESMALMPNGDVYPCRRLPTKIGNILKDDFGEILLRLQIFKEILDRNLKGKCKECRMKICLGCRALAYALTGDFYAEDPQCFL
ncbi:MAG: radical SAM protein [candidate division WOR-3 bacterium]